MWIHHRLQCLLLHYDQLMINLNLFHFLDSDQVNDQKQQAK